MKEIIIKTLMEVSGRDLVIYDSLGYNCHISADYNIIVIYKGFNDEELIYQLNAVR